MNVLRNFWSVLVWSGLVWSGLVWSGLSSVYCRDIFGHFGMFLEILRYFEKFLDVLGRFLYVLGRVLDFSVNRFFFLMKMSFLLNFFW